MSKRRGRKSAAQTPAPKAEQIKGSKKNPKGTAASELSAARIKLSSDTMGTLKKKLDEFKEKHPKKKNVTLNDLKAVYRRGSGAYSSSHRPTITGGRPNSRAAWSYARVNKFLEKAAGKKVKAAYVQDDDLLENGGITEVDYIIKNDSDKYYSRNLATGGVKWNDSQDMAYMLKKNEAEDVVTKLESEGYKNLIIDKYDKEWWKKMEEGGEIFEKGGKTKGKGDCYQAAGDFAIGKYFAPKIDFRGEPYIVHAEVTGQGSIEGLRYGHAWVEDDIYIYDYSNNREIVFPKELYYRIGEVNTKDPKKYRRYTFAEARKKMLDTGNYGSWDIETEYTDGGLIAPNGKNSNLTPEQYKLVRTPEFKAWFGDWENEPENASNVVDENGEPLVLHRGNLVSQEELGYTFNLGQNFLKKESGNEFGFFFSNEIDTAKKYMLVDHFDEIRGGSVTSVFIQANKILDLLDFGLKIGQDNFVQGLIEKGVIFTDEYSYLEKKILDFNPDNYKYWGYNVFDYFDVFPELRNLFIKNGFNSVIFYEMSRKHSKYKVYVAFNSNQIKLADGTNKTFDSNNPDIRYKDGGETNFDFKNTSIAIIEKDEELFDWKGEYGQDGKFYSNIIVPKKSIYAWLYNVNNAQQKIDKGEFDAFYCTECKGLSDYFESKNQKNYKGAEHLIAILKCRIDDKKLYLLSMATKPSLRKQGIMSHFINEVRKKYNVKMEDVIFIGMTEQGKKFYKKGKYEQGGELGEQITCVKCDWTWNTTDSDESDKYVCHKCGFDNSLFYDTDILKPNLTVQEIAEKHNVEVDYVLDQLIKGAEHELEHTNDELEDTQRNDFAKRIALHHIAETPDYYEKLDQMNLEEGAEIEEIILEDNSSLEADSQLEVDIAEYLMQQNAEAQEVLYCSDSRVFKAMICKTKIEIAQNRLENTENPEEQNCWNECIIIWTDCMNYIVENNIPVREYKDGGSPCGCSKMYEKGGLAYGNSHDKGGMPLEVSSTGQKIEIEGGEGVVNKRSMQMTKKLEFEGRKMTPCEVVSKINEMGGGVKFKCSDVKEIIAEDGHF